MGIFRKETIKCTFCKKKEQKRKAWQIVMKTAEGPHKVKICNECAKTLESTKEEIMKYVE